MRKRLAFTLVEMLAVIAVGSVLITIAMTAVSRTMRLETAWRGEGDISRSFLRLSQDFRRDAHEAEAVVVSQDPLEAEFTFANGKTVRYAVSEKELLRESQVPDEQTQREFYKKPAEYQATLATLSEPDRITLQINRTPIVTGKPLLPYLNLEAQIGRLARLARSSGGSP